MPIISKLRDRGKYRLFAAPAVELQSVPNYFEVIEKPMDFRPIRQERIPEYQTVEDLKNDLELVFSNCHEYNGVDSQCGQIAT